MNDVPAILIENLRKAYGGWFGRGGQDAVQGIDLRVPTGEVWALVGPNGAGKTTTLNCLLGLLHPDGGRVEVLGLSPRLAATRRHIGFQSEIFFSYAGMSAARCLSFYGELGGLYGANLQTQVQRSLQRVGLQDVGNKRMGKFSKGMVQRLGLAQSLLHDPDVYIWDEPTSGLDPEGRRLVVDLVKELKAAGRTVLLSTHVLADIERVCDGVTMIQRGRVVLNGRIATLCQEHSKSLEDLYLSAMQGSHHAA